MLDPGVCRAAEKSVLCWLATSTPVGEPSVSPKEIFSVFLSDSIIIANIASPQSARNIRANPQACVSFIDVFSQKGFQIRGTALYLRAGDEHYTEIEATLLEMTQGLFPFKSAFRVMADTVNEILAPRYRFYPETTEAQQIASAMKTYGVQPRS